MSQLTNFLDDGGVMNDNRLRAVQWQRLVGEFFVPLLGGTHEAWMEANRRVVYTILLEDDNWQRRVQANPDYASFDYTYNLDWLGGMCELVGVPTPPADETVELAQRAALYITNRVYSPFPGAVETIRLLHGQGYALHTASGEPSTSLEGYLRAMGVRDCFGRLYGSDLIETMKGLPLLLSI